MKTLFIDTETTALPDMQKRASDPSQPHLVQFAAILMDGETELECHNLIIKPDGWTISPEVAAIHGITQERAEAEGVPEKFVADLALALIRESELLVAHNLQFDKFLIRVALRRYGIMTDEMDLWWKGLPTFCTMWATTDICKLPGKYGKFKWPKLMEAHQHLFGEGFEGAHDALADVRACARIYSALQKGVAA